MNRSTPPEIAFQGRAQRDFPRDSITMAAAAAALGTHPPRLFAMPAARLKITTEGIRIAAIVRTYNRLLVPHQTLPPIGVAANLHYMACFAREDRAQEYDTTTIRAVLDRANRSALKQ
jgi:L-alanine-DL-glutamate epimerase-like enolase superfamily enzyme